MSEKVKPLETDEEQGGAEGKRQRRAVVEHGECWLYRLITGQHSPPRYNVR